MSKPTQIITGIPASGGSAEGRVRIVFSNADLKKVERGDIIVARMTNPDMVLAMGKCSAIITDSGGLTCHAAVISRERAIPCVTGTQNATILLKDGMLVKVDGTNGQVHILEGLLSTENKNDALTRFTIFGNSVPVFAQKVFLTLPLCERIDYAWKAPDKEKEYQWITPRPEIYGSFVQRSLIGGGIERVPHALGFEDLSPLYVRYHQNVCIEFQTTSRLLKRLSQKFIQNDSLYWGWFLHRLQEVYESFDKATARFESVLTSEQAVSPELVEHFISWWAVHNEFFSHTYLIQSMGDDIVGPRLRELVAKACRDNATVADCMSILLRPVDVKEIVISNRFAIETSRLLESASEEIKDQIFSAQDERTIMGSIAKIPDGRDWLERLQNHTNNWWWIRTRDPYFDPISNAIGMLSAIRKSDHETKEHVSLKENKLKFGQTVDFVEGKLGVSDNESFTFTLNAARKLSQERDNHHHHWIRNLSIIRPFFTLAGKQFTSSKLIHEKDIYFLTLPEIIDLIRNPNEFKKEVLMTKVEKRMAHYSYVARLGLHRQVSASNFACVDDAF
ncbi:MAG: PEP-utilizing enzyme [Candidatus Bathyarchaeia archaeon]